MPAPPVSTLPPAPAPTDSKTEFNVKAYPFVASLTTMAAEMNAVSDWINANLNSIGPSTFTDIVVDAPAGDAVIHLRQAGIENGSLYATGTSSKNVALQAFGNVRLLTGTTPALAATFAQNGNTGFGVTTPDTSARIQSLNGIKLGNSANANANVLDWYEEGTFTPTIAGSTVIGVGTYSIQQGRYTRYGDNVTIVVRLAWSSHSGTGDLKVAGLPFTSAGNPRVSLGVYSNTLLVGSGKQLASIIEVSNTTVSLVAMDLVGGATGSVPMDPSVTELIISGTYFV